MTRQRRERGDGAVFFSKRRNRWVGQLDAGMNDSGARVRPLVVGRTRDEARAKLAELKGARDKGLDVRTRHITSDELADLWLARDIEGHVSDETLFELRVTAPRAHQPRHRPHSGGTPAGG